MQALYSKIAVTINSVHTSRCLRTTRLRRSRLLCIWRTPVVGHIRWTHVTGLGHISAAPHLKRREAATYSYGARKCSESANDDNRSGTAAEVGRAPCVDSHSLVAPCREDMPDLL
jgi:hypothetical protein